MTAVSMAVVPGATGATPGRSGGERGTGFSDQLAAAMDEQPTDHSGPSDDVADPAVVPFLPVMILDASGQPTAPAAGAVISAVGASLAAGSATPAMTAAAQAAAGEGAAGEAASAGQAASGQTGAGQEVGGQATTGQATGGLTTAGQTAGAPAADGQAATGPASAGQASAAPGVVAAAGSAAGRSVAVGGDAGMRVGPGEPGRLGQRLKQLTGPGAGLSDGPRPDVAVLPPTQPGAADPFALITTPPGQAGATGPAAAQPAPPAAPQSPATQLAELFRPLRGADGPHRLTVHLNPADLGPVSVLAVIRGGDIHVHLAGATEAGREALRTALPELRRELEHAGFSTSSLDLAQDAPSQGQPRQQPTAPHPEPAHRPAPDTPATSRPPATDHVLDLHV